MKRILALIAVIMLTIAPFTVEAADLNVTFSSSNIVSPGQNMFIMPVEITNNGTLPIAKGAVSIVSIGDKPVGVESGFTYISSNQTSKEILNLDPGKNTKVTFELSVSYSAEPGIKKVVFKLDSEGLSATGEGTVEVIKPATPPSLGKINVNGEGEASVNSNFAYVVKVENPSTTEGPSQDMLDVVVELLDINGKPITEFDKETAETDSFFRTIFKAPLKLSPDNSEKKLAPSESFEAKFMMATGPDITLETYKAKIKVTWKYPDTKLPPQEKIFEGSIKVTQVQWYTYAVRWFIDAVRNTVGFKDYGIAIIIFAIVVKLLFWPLTNAQFKNMAKMAKIQPMINELKRKYPGNENKQKLQEETLKVYKENNVNLLSGCLPLLIQLPIIMALYSGISGYAPLNYANFLWLPSLGLPDKIYIMAILLAASTWFQQKVSTMPGQDEQSATFQIMFPAIIFLFGINFPSGISLYWFMFNFATIIHQMIYNKAAFGTYIPTPMFKQKAPVKETKNVK